MSLDVDKYHLKSHSFFEFLSKDEEFFVKTHTRRIELKKKQILFREDSFSKGIYIIKKGKVKIYKTNPDGKESIVYIYKKGDYFGYRPLLANDPHPVSAAAIDNVVISFIPIWVFNEVLEKSPHLAQKLLISLSKEFSVWIKKMTAFANHSVKERVALSLLILARVYEREDSTSKLITVSLNRNDFSGFVGTAKETLVRMLRVFKDEKTISARGTKIIILKPKALEKLIDNY
ncbi:MAG: Crp/Fnr family transcriptional regulator [Sphingobacteriaceae bacterium]|nr:Crp/Fnr family transcriptional regulator [Sphingobacteriaceae bacterium]